MLFEIAWAHNGNFLSLCTFLLFFVAGRPEMCALQSQSDLDCKNCTTKKLLGCHACPIIRHGELRYAKQKLTEGIQSEFNLAEFFLFKTRDSSQKQTRFWNTYTPMTHGLWSVADKTRKNPLVSCMVVWRIWGDSAREKNCVSMASTRRILIMKPRSHDRLYHHHRV